jgi:hypothetical protein
MVSFVESSAVKTFLVVLFVVQILILSLQFYGENFSFLSFNKTAATTNADDTTGVEYKYVASSITIEESNKEENDMEYKYVVSTTTGVMAESPKDEEHGDGISFHQILRILRPKEGKEEDSSVVASKAGKETKAPTVKATKASSEKHTKSDTTPAPISPSTPVAPSPVAPSPVASSPVAPSPVAPSPVAPSPVA